ncbi:F0F1 ATP synthase subunit delta [Mycetocola reblochoni]|uniref:ATP synthase subunit delta n=2 Tax=Mycetocola reblochoni TaxID=331618 RepID=A0A1R4JTV0_9MICO|nr:F0F1 ATP synthase subunit delta [Mycetocola reblochoni]RLP70384.1 F0F1 ATP synthase subunit delta [Mycetocola reblochoni]SJN35409.1 ATP synthase delta chain [Mycetocola reblochoni REB411]
MGSASREALASARGVLEGTSSDARAAADVLSTARVLSENPALLSALADATADSGATIALVSRLFGQSAAPEALPVIEAVVSSRWSSSAELVDGLEEIGLRAYARTSDARVLSAELLSVGRAIASDPELELALGSRLGDPAAKAVLVERLFSGRVSDAAVAVTAHLVRSPRGRRTRALLVHAARIVADQAGRLVAEVRAAAPLDDDQSARLAAELGTSYGRAVDLDVVVDPSLLGGLRVEIAGDVIDGSVSTRISELRQKLAG